MSEETKKDPEIILLEHFHFSLIQEGDSHEV